MRKYRELCLASVFALALTGVAGAADLPVKAPIVVPVPVYSWTGFYIGLGGGAGWGTKEYSYDQDATWRALDRWADDQNWNRWWNRGPFGRADASHDINGGFFGGQIGANWQAGWVVFGVQAEWYWADIEGKGSGHTGAFADGPRGNRRGNFGTTASIRSKVDSFGSVTGRLGAAFDRVLVYAKAGVAWEDAEHQVTLHGEYLGNCLGGRWGNGNGGACGQSQTVGQTRTGFTFGTGVEVAFDNNWSAFVEYNYYDFDTDNANYMFDILNIDEFDGGASVPYNTEVTEYLHTIKAGINYKFNWWGGPVVARY